MPELPEVETIRLGLSSLVAGARVTGVRVLDARAVRRHPGGPEDFVRRLAGRVLEPPRRRGKYLWFSLGGHAPLWQPRGDAPLRQPRGDAPLRQPCGEALLCHLGMSGQFRVDDAGAPVPRHTRVVLGLDDGRELRFCDQRLFGGMQIAPQQPSMGSPVPVPVAHIGLDPFDDGFDAAAAGRRLRARRSTLKRALLDQTLVSGIGNIYADETLWRARRHPETPTGRLRAREATGLFEIAEAVMAEAIGQGGTSFDRLYVRVNGESGYFGRSLDVYGREGLACRRCGTTLTRMAFMNRSSYLCPHCQRWPRGVPRME